MRVQAMIVVVTLLKPFSNVFLAWGMHDIPSLVATHPASLIQAMLDPLVIIGVAMQIAWLLLRMSLLSVADLSFILPVTAAGYVVTTFLGRVILHEQVSPERWAGAILISAGTALVASTPRRTSERGGAVR
jgi:uncharacterized membrane protein